MPWCATSGDGCEWVHGVCGTLFSVSQSSCIILFHNHPIAFFFNKDSQSHDIHLQFWCCTHASVQMISIFNMQGFFEKLCSWPCRTPLSRTRSSCQVVICGMPATAGFGRCGQIATSIGCPEKRNSEMLWRTSLPKILEFAPWMHTPFNQHMQHFAYVQWIHQDVYVVCSPPILGPHQHKEPRELWINQEVQIVQSCALFVASYACWFSKWGPCIIVFWGNSQLASVETWARATHGLVYIWGFKMSSCDPTSQEAFYTAFIIGLSIIFKSVPCRYYIS